MSHKQRGRKTTRLHWSEDNKQLHKKPVVLVTGTSSGIGWALAKLLWVCHDYRVVVTARPQSLPKLIKKFPENERFWIRPLDVTSEESISTLIEEINLFWNGVDILINNAGVAYRSVVEDMTCPDEDIQMKTNYKGPFALIRKVLPSMRKKRAGHIINISSVSGMMAMPTMASYSASKFALEGATEALWYEMKPWNINVNLIQPGFVNSESFKRVRYTDKFFDSFQEDTYRNYYLNMAKLIEKLMKLSPTNHYDVAKAILKTIQKKKKKLRIPVTWDAHFFALLRKCLPATIYHQLLYRFLPNIKNWAKPISMTKTTQTLELEAAKISSKETIYPNPKSPQLDWGAQ